MKNRFLIVLFLFQMNQMKAQDHFFDSEKVASLGQIQANLNSGLPILDSIKFERGTKMRNNALLFGIPGSLILFTSGFVLESEYALSGNSGFILIGAVVVLGGLGGTVVYASRAIRGEALRRSARRSPPQNLTFQSNGLMFRLSLTI